MSNFRKPTLYVVLLSVIILLILGFTLLANPTNLNMKEDFAPKSIETEVDGEMRNIYFSEEAINEVANLLKYDTWEKAEMKYDLATMTYLSDNGDKVIGLYDDVDGETYFDLYSGFGLRNGDFYKAPLEIYNDIKKYTTEYYHKTNPIKVETPQSNETLESKTLNYALITDLASGYGYDGGVILESKQHGAELLIYNSQINSKADLLVKKIKINNQNEIIYEEDIYLPEDLVGYTLGFKYGDSSKKEHLLATRHAVNKKDKKMYSDLLVFDKNLKPMKITILQSYETDYDGEKGIVPTGVIPTVVEFSVDVVGDYIVYEDVDLYYKVQDVRTKEIYASEENDPTLLATVIPSYSIQGDYIYVVKYDIDNSVLAFNTSSKKFEKLK